MLRPPATALPHNIESTGTPLQRCISRVSPQNLHLVRALGNIENWPLTGNRQPPCLCSQSFRHISRYNKLLPSAIVDFCRACPGMAHEATNTFAVLNCAGEVCPKCRASI